MIAKCFHVCLTSRRGITLGVRWTHVCRIFANDVCESPFVLDHLLLSQVRGDIRQAVVRPSVGSDLMSLGDHPLNYSWVGCCCIDRAFSDVVTGNEERGVKAILLQDV